MKKILAILLALVMILSLAACANVDAACRLIEQQQLRDVYKRQASH